MKRIYNHHQAKPASALLLVIVGLVMIGGGLAAFFALSLVEDNDLNTLQLSKELDSIAMTGIELAAQAVNQGDLDFLDSTGDVDSFVFEDEDVDGDSTADGNGFGTYTAQFDETDLPLAQIAEYDMIITVTRNSEISNTQGLIRTVGDPRKVIITAEVRDANDNRKRLKAVYYKPWFNGNADDITKPQAENWFFIKSGTSTDEPMASYDSSQRGGVGQPPTINQLNFTNYGANNVTTTASEAFDLHSLRIEKTAWLTEFQNDVGEGGSTAESGIFYRDPYDPATFGSGINQKNYNFEPQIIIPSKLARAVDEIDLVDNTYENSGLKSSNNLGRFVISGGKDYTQKWETDYLPHKGFFNNYISPSVPVPLGTAVLPNTGGSMIADMQINVAGTVITGNINVNADDLTLYIQADNVRIDNSSDIIVSAGISNFRIVVDSTVNNFTIENNVYSLSSGDTSNILLVAEGSTDIFLNHNQNLDFHSYVSAYNRAVPYKDSFDAFIGTVYAPQANIYAENFFGLSIAKNVMCSGIYLHNRAVNAQAINLKWPGTIIVDHSDTSIYPSDTTKYYLLSIEDDSGSTES